MRRNTLTRRAIGVLAALTLPALGAGQDAAGDPTVTSPDGSLTVAVQLDDRISYTVSLHDQLLVGPAPISLTLGDGRILGADPSLAEAHVRSVDEEIEPVVAEKNARVRNRYSELALDLGDFDVIFRAYDDAVAYRFRTRLGGELVVRAEQVEIPFAADHTVFFPKEEGFVSHNERRYERRELAGIGPEELASLPTLVSVEGGPKLLIAESDLRSYPGMWLLGTGGDALAGTFPEYVVEEHMANDRNSVVDARADYLARTDGTRSFPWRILVVAERDAELLESQAVYRLGGDLELEDTSWIRPGKVAWDWYNYNNVFGVDFRAGVNTETYEFYIDFASEHGIDYVILDEGWYVLGDLLKQAPDMEVPRLFEYAKARGVRLIPWVIWKTLEDQLEPALEQFERWGAAGIKVDFMQRDDQRMVEYYERIAREAAQRHLLVDYHGAYKPAGLRRRYPNVITREGVQGLEHDKWSADTDPEHDVTLPFIRMVAGPMDYTPGAMLNAQKSVFHPVFTRPMSQGTRCHQLAMYVVFESPLQMLADSPSQYLREPEAMELLSAVPTTWDETRALDGRVGDYVVVARRKGSSWYVGAMTDWEPRELELDLGFLPEGEHRLEIWQDGPNADRYASDFHRASREVTAADRIPLRLAPGGGWVGRIETR